MLLQHRLCPLFLKSPSDRRVFPLTFGCIRVAFPIPKQFLFELETKAEVVLRLPIGIIAEDSDASNHSLPGCKCYCVRGSRDNWVWHWSERAKLGHEAPAVQPSFYISQIILRRLS